MEFRSNNLKMFISTLWYDNVNNYDFFRLKNVFSFEDLLRLHVFNHLTKVRWNFELKKKISNKGLKKTFIKLLVYIYTNVQLCFNFIFMIFVSLKVFEAQIIYMWSLKYFKVNEILCVATFDTICNCEFPSNCVHRSVHSPFLTTVSNIWQNRWLVSLFHVGLLNIYPSSKYYFQASTSIMAPNCLLEYPSFA
jgi:hypothetical protein